MSNASKPAGNKHKVHEASQVCVLPCDISDSPCVFISSPSNNKKSASPTIHL